MIFFIPFIPSTYHRLPLTYVHLKTSLHIIIFRAYTVAIKKRILCSFAPQLTTPLSSPLFLHTRTLFRLLLRFLSLAISFSFTSLYISFLSLCSLISFLFVASSSSFFHSLYISCIPATNLMHPSSLSLLSSNFSRISMSARLNLCAWWNAEVLTGKRLCRRSWRRCRRGREEVSR
jgi:hypothetical protein